MRSPPVDNGGSIVRSLTPGPPLLVTFTIVDDAHQPVADAAVDIWHASPVGLYENQEPEQADMNLRGKFTTDTDGKIFFRSVRPAGYPIPTEGVVGRLLKAQGRHPYRPAHVHALVVKEGYKTLISQVYDDDDPQLQSDAQFGVTRALCGHFVEHAEAHPEYHDLVPPWYSLEHTLVLEHGEAHLPRPPIK